MNVSYFKRIKEIFLIIGKENKKKFYIFIILAFLTTLLEMLSLTVLVPLFDFIFQNDSITDSKILFYLKKITNLSFNTDSLLFFILIIIFLIFLFKNMFIIFYNKFLFKWVYSLQEQISKKLYDRYTNKDIGYYSNTNTSLFIRNITFEVNEFIATLTGLLSLFTELFLFAGIVIFLLLLSFKQTILIMSVTTLFFIFAVMLFKVKLQKFSYQRQKKNGLRLKFIQNTFNNIYDLFDRNFIDYSKNKFKKINFEFSNINKKRYFFLSIPRNIIEIYFIFLVLSLIYFQTENINKVMSTLAIYVVVIIRFLPSLTKLTSSLNVISNASSSIEIICDEFNSSNNFEKKPNLTEKIIFKENSNILKFDNINFSYKNNQIVKNFSFDLKEGFLNCITGDSGSGKSTIATIVRGINLIESGDIYLNKKKISRNFLLNNSYYLAQNFSLFDDTLLSNIILSNENEVEKGRLQKIILDSGLDKFINGLDFGLKTSLGEKGALISGGQMQRIGIARALYSKKRILILDEITNGLDINVEKHILQNLSDLTNEKIILIISHKKEVINYCDNLIKI